MKLKWEPLALMVLLMGLGVWMVWNSKHQLVGIQVNPASRTMELRIGNSKGVVELLEGHSTARILLRNGHVSEAITRSQLEQWLGATATQDLFERPPNALFRLFNITSWTGLIWVMIGLGGQAAFFGRMLIQWIVSEKTRQSVVPAVFWWLSLAGGVALFAYFVWRQDFVGVLGQSTGVVIYARNLRLIAKQRAGLMNSSRDPTS